MTKESLFDFTVKRTNTSVIVKAKSVALADYFDKLHKQQKIQLIRDSYFFKPRLVVDDLAKSVFSKNYWGEDNKKAEVTLLREGCPRLDFLFTPQIRTGVSIRLKIAVPQEALKLYIKLTRAHIIRLLQSSMSDKVKKPVKKSKKIVPVINIDSETFNYRNLRFNTSREALVES